MLIFTAKSLILSAVSNGWFLQFDDFRQVLLRLGLQTDLLKHLDICPATSAAAPTSSEKEGASVTDISDVLEALLEILASSTRAHADKFSADDLVRFMSVVCFLSLDSNLIKTFRLKFPVHNALAALLDALPPSTWQEQCSQICSHCMQMTSFHHNSVHLSSNWPTNERGQYMQRLVSASFLRRITDGGGDVMESVGVSV